MVRVGSLFIGCELVASQKKKNEVARREAGD